MSKLSWKVGDYAMHCMDGREPGTLVRIISESDRKKKRFGIQYVQRGDDSGSSLSWPESEFRPITDALDYAYARKHAEGVKFHDARVAMDRAEKEQAAWRRAAEAIVEARKAVVVEEQDEQAEPVERG